MNSPMLHTFGLWLQDTRVAGVIQDLTWIVPTVQTVHILCIAIVVSGVAIVDLRMLGVLARKQPLNSLVARFLPPVWPALLMLLITGTILFVGEPMRSIENAAFYTKLTLIVCVAIITRILQGAVGKDPNYWESSPARRRLGASLAMVSMLFWTAIVFAGRFIAYVGAGT